MKNKVCVSFKNVWTILAMVVIIAGRVHAATVTWDGSGNMTWTQPDSTSWGASTYNTGDEAIFAGAGQGTVTITGPVTPSVVNITSGSYIFSGIIGGSATITNSGAGTLTLSGANTYAGGTTINAGTVKVGNATGLGANSSAVSVTSGAVLDVNGITMTGTNALTLIGSGIGGTGALINSSATAATYAGAITLNSASTIGNTGTTAVGSAFTALTLSSIVNNNGNLLTFKGTGVITLGGASGISGGGGVTVDGVYINLNGPSAANMTYGGTTTIQNGGAILQGVSNHIPTTGNIVLNGGYIDGYNTLGFTRALGTLPNQIQITGGISGFGVYGSGTVNLGGAGATLTWGTATFDPAALMIGTPGAATSLAGTTTFANAIDLNGTTRIILANGGTINAGAISGVISNSSGTPAGLTKTGAATLTLSGNNTFNGQLTVEIGTLAIGSINNVSANGVLGNSALSVLLGSSGITGTLKYTGGTASSTKPFTLATGGTGAFDVSTATTILTLSGQIDGSGALSKVGAGTLTLSGANTYSGTTTVNVGTLAIAKEAALYNGNSASWTAANINVKAGATLALNVDSEGTAGFTAANLSTLLGNISVANTAAEGVQSGANLALNTSTASGGTFTTSGAFGGGFGLNKIGTGTLALSGNNTYSGSTTISAGVLQYNDGAIIPTTPLMNNASLVINRSSGNDLTQGSTFHSIMMGTGSLTNIGTGTLVLGNINTYTGTTKANAGTIQLSHPLALMNSAIDTTSAGTFTFSGVTAPTIGGLSGASGNLASVFSTGYSSVTNLILNPSASVTYGSVIADNAGMTLTMAGTGTQIFTNSNTYAGATYLNAGTLELSGSGSILNSAITLSGGGLKLSNATAGEQTFDRVNGTGITANGGTLTYNNTSGTNIYAETIGSVALTSGQLNIVEAVNQAGTGSQTLTLGGLSQSGSSVATFSSASGLNTTKNMIVVTNAIATTANQIIGPWATVGTAANAQTDYAIYNGSAQVVPAAIGTSVESTWANTTDAYTRNAGFGVTKLTATRNINALRSISAANTVTFIDSQDRVTLTGHGFAVGDALVFGGTGTPAPPLVKGTVYYVQSIIDVNGFTVSTTPGGGAINLTSVATAPNEAAGAILLSTGNNLGTLGILNGVSSTMAIAATGTGTVTLPTTSAGNLYVTTGSGAITISAPITDNTGALTLVASGSSTLTLSGVNTYTGGTVVNGGTVRISANSNLGAAGSALTFNGSGGLTLTTAMTSDHPIGLNNGAVMNLKAEGATGTISAPITGTGGINWVSSGKTLSLSSTGNTFTGPIGATGAGMTADGDVFQFASIGDAPGAGGIYFNNSGGGSSPFQYIGAANLIFNYRQLVVNRTATASGGGTSANSINVNGAGTLTINTDLLVANSAAGTPWFAFGGSNTGTNSFNGRITDGAAGVLTVLKDNGGNWYFSGTNTYSGGTRLSGGQLTFQGIQALPTSGTLTFNSTATVAILDDGSGVIDRSGVNLAENNRPLTLFVGNNSTANGGKSSGTTAGSVINLGVLNMVNSSGWYGRQMNITGANGYSVRLAVANLSWYGGPFAGKFNPTTASIEITGILRQANGKTLASLGVGTDGQPSPYLSLDGTSSGNIISGTIMDAADYTDSSNPNARALGVTKSSTSEWILSGTNTYTGITKISGGTLEVVPGIGLPSASYLQLDGGVLQAAGTFTRVNSTTVNGANVQWLSASGGGFSARGGKLTVTINNSASTEQVWGTAVGNNVIWGTLKFGSATANSEVEFQNDIDMANGTRTVDVASGTGGDFATLSGVIRTASGTAALTKTGAGTLVLTGANTYNGATTISAGGGTLVVSSIANASSPNPLGQSSAVAASLSLGSNTTLKYTGPTASTDRSFTIAGTAAGHQAALDASGTGAITFATTASPAYGTTAQSRLLILTGSNTDNNTLAANLPNNGAGAVSIQKGGTGTWVISGSNTYSGTTTVALGTLRLGGMNALPTNTTIVIGAGTLDMAGYTKTVNTLDVTGAGTINLDAGGKLVFANSSSQTWLNGTLRITGAFVSGSSIKFATSGGLTPAQLAKISMSGVSSFVLNDTGYLVAIRPTLILLK